MRRRLGIRQWLARIRPGGHDELSRYWEGRARDLIATYDRPETWPERRWLRAGAEDEVVPRLLSSAGVRSVLVPGCGSGRQFRFLSQHGFELSGFDISPTMIKTCRARFPDIHTVVASVVGCETLFDPRDAVFSSAVLAHVPPGDVEPALNSLKMLAGKLLILREKTRFAEESDYQWAHRYEDLLADWRLVYREVTDEGDTFAAELMAWEPP